MSALSPFHAALYARLSADAGLAAYQHASMATAGVEIYDHVPGPQEDEPARYPYIAIESHAEGRVGIFGGRGFDSVAQLGVWDDYRGFLRVLEIMELIDAALIAALPVAGFGSVRARISLATTLRDPSGLRHGVVQVQALNLA